MSQGLDAVRHELKRGFGDIAFYMERYDPADGSTVISFQAGANKFLVQVCKEFEDDYESGLTGTLSGLAAKLRGSKSKRIIVGRGGVVSCDFPFTRT